MGDNKLNNVQQTVKQIKDGYGVPRAGFEEYFKQCQPVPFPTAAPDVCHFYKTPDNILVHSLTVQPFYDSRPMKSRDSDVLIVSFPKAGTTWVQEITYLVAHNADFNKAKSAPVEYRVLFLEAPQGGIRAIENMEDPRLIKSHQNYELLPKDFQENKNSKIVYVARNPKDVAVSYYHFYKMVGFVAYDGAFEQLVHRAFDFDETGGRNYFTHVLGYWNRRHQGNILFLLYEDLQKDLEGNIRKIANFLGKSLTDEQVTGIAEHCSFDNMSKNPMANYSHGGTAVKRPDATTNFMRKGKVGDWKNHFNEELNKKMDKVIEKYLNGTGLVFEYEI